MRTTAIFGLGFTVLSAVVFIRYRQSRSKALPFLQYWCRRNVTALAHECAADLVRNPGRATRSLTDLFSAHEAWKDYMGRSAPSPLVGILTKVATRELRECVEGYLAGVAKYRDGIVLHDILTLLDQRERYRLVDPSVLRTARMIQRQIRRAALQGMWRMFWALTLSGRAAVVGGVILPPLFSALICASRLEDESKSLNAAVAQRTEDLLCTLDWYISGRAIAGMRLGAQSIIRHRCQGVLQSELTSALFLHLASCDQRYIDYLFGNTDIMSIQMAIGEVAKYFETFQTVITNTADSCKLLWMFYCEYGVTGWVYLVSRSFTNAALDYLYSLLSATNEEGIVPDSPWCTASPKSCPGLVSLIVHGKDVMSIAGPSPTYFGLALLAENIHVVPPENASIFEALTSCLQAHQTSPLRDRHVVVSMWRQGIAASAENTPSQKRSVVDAIDEIFEPQTFMLLRSLGSETHEVSRLMLEDRKALRAASSLRRALWLFLDNGVVNQESPLLFLTNHGIPTLLASHMVAKKHGGEVDAADLEDLDHWGSQWVYRAASAYEFSTDTEGSNAVLLLTTILSTLPTIDTGRGLREVSLHGHIEFREVTFAYPTNPTVKVLDKVSFVARPGEVVGIVGMSGSGKSTLFALLLGFYRCDEGEILIDGRLIEDYDASWLRTQMGYVPPHAVLLDGTLEANIMYTKPSASCEEVMEAATKAHLHHVILEKSGAYHHRVSVHRPGLSGGEKQRLGIARGLLAPKKVYLLDEVSSALDAVSEDAVRRALAKMQGITMLVIAHRLRTVREADRILVLEKGTVTQWGSHEELLQHAEGTYAKLVALQAVHGDEGADEVEDDWADEEEEESEDDELEEERGEEASMHDESADMEEEEEEGDELKSHILWLAKRVEGKGKVPEDLVLELVKNIP